MVRTCGKEGGSGLGLKLQKNRGGRRGVYRAWDEHLGREDGSADEEKWPTVASVGDGS